MSAPIVLRYSQFFTRDEEEFDTVEEALDHAAGAIEFNEFCPIEIVQGDKVLCDWDAIRRYYSQWCDKIDNPLAT